MRLRVTDSDVGRVITENVELVASIGTCHQRIVHAHQGDKLLVGGKESAECLAALGDLAWRGCLRDRGTPEALLWLVSC